MTFDTQELIFAAQVRDLAIAIRSEAAATEKQEAERDLPDEQKERAIDFAIRHAKSHPATEYVPAAMERITGVAMAIREYLKAQS